MTEREAALEEALRNILRATKSHVDGRDLLDELHPYHTIDIQVRCDGRERWHEGDWLMTLRKFVQDARLLLDTKSAPVPVTAFEMAREQAKKELTTLRNVLGVDGPPKETEEQYRSRLLANHIENAAKNLAESKATAMTLDAIKEKLRAIQAEKLATNTFHQLKCWPEFFGAIQRGEKRHDLRRNDRNFKVGDMIELWEFDPKLGEGFTGLTQDVRITYITSADSPCAYSEIGLQPGFCILSLTTDVEDDE